MLFRTLQVEHVRHGAPQGGTNACAAPASNHALCLHCCMTVDAMLLLDKKCSWGGLSSQSMDMSVFSLMPAYSQAADTSRKAPQSHVCCLPASSTERGPWSKQKESAAAAVVPHRTCKAMP